MEKFSQISYQRLDEAQFKKSFAALLDRFKSAATYEQARAAFLDMDALQSDADTCCTIASVRNTMNMMDDFYDAEMEYYNAALPALELMCQDFTKALLDSPFKADFEREFGAMFLKTARESLRLQKESAVPLMVREAQLQSEYQKAAAACKTEFMGQDRNFYGLLRFMEDDDRAVRRAAFEAWAKLYGDNSSKLEDVFARLIATRNDIAKELGFNNYIELAYANRRRYDYTQKDVESFRAQIIDVVVPLCAKLRQEQRKRIGVEKLKYYDEQYMFTDGNAMPIGAKDDLVNAASEMYAQLSPETGEFFDFMTKYELFDLETRPGKHLGGYCTALAKYKAPFIFSNFNGTGADVDVLTHEAGHAFEAYTSMRCQPISENVHSTSEINEIHSMAMELFTYPLMDKFFGDTADKYRYSHLCEALFVLPYMCAVDEFQHRVYVAPKADSQTWRAIWHELEQKYLPWRDYDGNEFLEGGGFWMQKQHIFLYPFYYIDYALAQTAVFDLYGEMKRDKNAAWQRYLKLCRAGGSKGYFELLALAGIRVPFEPGAVKAAVENVMDDVKKWPL